MMCRKQVSFGNANHVLGTKCISETLAQASGYNAPVNLRQCTKA